MPKPRSISVINKSSLHELKNGEFDPYIIAAAKLWINASEEAKRDNPYESWMRSVILEWYDAHELEDRPQEDFITNVSRAVYQELQPHSQTHDVEPRRLSIGRSFESFIYQAMVSHWSVILMVAGLAILLSLGDIITNKIGLVDPLEAQVRDGAFVSDLHFHAFNALSIVLSFSELFIKVAWFVLFDFYIMHPLRIHQHPIGFIIALFGFGLTIAMFAADTYYSMVAFYGPLRTPSLIEVIQSNWQQVEISIILISLLPTPVQHWVNVFTTQKLKESIDKAQQLQVSGQLG